MVRSICMKNPLRKRLFRELKSECGKYLVIFLLLTGSIGFVSGFLVADGSMLLAYDESFEKYNIEDGHFELDQKANRAQKKTLEDLGISLYDNFYTEEAMTNGSTLRIFSNRESVNLICLMAGRMPAGPGEIAIDRMYADNNQIKPGDTLTSDRYTFTVTGLVALSDYSCLFSNNNDSMFDSVKFGVAVVTPEVFSAFDEDSLTWCYSWKYDNPPADEAAERDLSEDLMKEMVKEVSLQEFVPRYQCQAIRFAGEDMGSDRAMMIALLYIIILIMAFVFAVTISSTISREANVIGTLRALGYTRWELIRHYMTVPIFVTGAGAILGNLLGYTIFKDVTAGMYYGSYSLPTYVTVWNGEAFLMTTAVPAFLMFAVNLLILCRKLTLSPLKFLRRDLSRHRQRRTFLLPKFLPFFSRFRMRVIFQNMGNYLILLVGILFANLLLMFGLLFPSVLVHYQQELTSHMLVNYQYMLKIPADAMNEDRKLQSALKMLLFQLDAETENEDAEKFSAYSLKTPDGFYKSEEVLLYGVEPDSKYIHGGISKEQVLISSAYSEKYGIMPGDTITLKEAYEDTVYEFTVTGIYSYEGALAVFMDRERLNRTFDLGDDYFSGYFSDTRITDIDESCISSVVDLNALTKISRQLTVSMGGMMTMVNAFAVIMFMVLVYLLSSIIIEKNAQSISMAKILGYTDGEISRLYILPTSAMVVLFLLLSLPIEYHIMVYLFRAVMMSSISGWITFYVDPNIYIQMFALGVSTYGAVALMELLRIRRIPMDEALKNVE